MQRLLVTTLTFLVLAAFGVHAQTPEDTYVRIYSLIQDGDSAQAGNDIERALTRYTEALTALQRLQNISPNWSTNVVAFRLRYLGQRIEALRGIAPPTVTPFTPPSVVKPQPTPTPDPQLARISSLEQQLQSLQQDNAVLSAKLREALAIQPVSTDPRELGRAQEKLRQSERAVELLRASLDAEKARPKTDNAELDKLKGSLADANRKLAEQSQIVENWTREKTLLQDRLRELLTDSQALAALRTENELLKKQVADANAPGGSAEKGQELSRLLQQSQARVAALEADQVAYRAEKVLLDQRVAELQARSEQATAALQQKDTLQQQLETALADLQKERTRTAANKADKDRIGQLELERDFLKDQLARALKSPTNTPDLSSPDRINSLANELAGLRARLDAYEAKAVPYSAEELALFQTQTPGVASFDLNASLNMHLPRGDSAEAPRASRIAPANARQLIAEGQRAFAAKRYDEAEQKYLEALKVDAQSVFVLANLGAIELEMNKLSEAEQHLQSAVALDPQDAFSLTVLGYLRHQQQRSDDALSLLSRAAKADPKRADTQNYLGVALSQKGLRGPAEAALRRAINLDPAYGSAHANLAVVYIAQKPPMVELSRWHYEKALAAGYPRDPNLEKMLAANGAKPNP